MICVKARHVRSRSIEDSFDGTLEEKVDEPKDNEEGFETGDINDEEGFEKNDFPDESTFNKRLNQNEFDDSFTQQADEDADGEDNDFVEKEVVGDGTQREDANNGATINKRDEPEWRSKFRDCYEQRRDAQYCYNANAPLSERRKLQSRDQDWKEAYNACVEKKGAGHCAPGLFGEHAAKRSDSDWDAWKAKYDACRQRMGPKNTCSITVGQPPIRHVE